MSLPASQQRILDGIEKGLRAHDSRLASLFTIFNRLTKQEEMPRTERLSRKRTGAARVRWRTGRPGEAHAGGRAVPLMCAPGASGPGVLPNRLWAALVPIVVLTVIGALVLGWLIAPEGRCAHQTSASGTTSSLIAARGCPAKQLPAGRG